VLARDGRREFGGEEPGQRDAAGLVRFRGAQDDPAADVGEGTADIDAAAVEVDVADAQGGSLSPPKAGVGQQQDQQTPASGFGGEREDLGMGEVDVIAALRPGQAQARAGLDRMRPLRTAWSSAADMTKTHWRMPDGPSPLVSDSRETHCVRSAKVILASGTVRQVGMICCRISHWYWCRVLGLRSARDSSHASA
jgi:hypothetical protein